MRRERRWELGDERRAVAAAQNDTREQRKGQLRTTRLRALVNDHATRVTKSKCVEQV